ncbi:MAG: DMT family transporter [Treponema sp.]|nr:DMT family transporter [Treponema sp.]
MNKRVFAADGLLLVTAAVWGFGFVAQRSGMQYIGPFAFNGIRFLLGSLSLLPIIAIRKRKNTALNSESKDLSKKKALIISSFIAGTILFVGVSFQQLGIMITTAGNAGFITGLYVILTPIFGIFLGKKTGPATWAGALLTLTGLYFLSLSGPAGSINPGDLIIIISAVFWTCHVLIIDKLVQNTDPIALSSGQFAFAGFYALIAAFLLEPVLSDQAGKLDPEFLATGLFGWKSFPVLIRGLASGLIPFSHVSSAIVPILYGGLGAVGIGYTLQAVAQKNAPPAHTTIILCLEGCFAALGGVLLLNEALGKRTILGFALMLAGMLISQWELIKEQNKK